MILLLLHRKKINGNIFESQMRTNLLPALGRQCKKKIINTQIFHFDRPFRHGYDAKIRIDILSERLNIWRIVFPFRKWNVWMHGWNKRGNVSIAQQN